MGWRGCSNTRFAAFWGLKPAGHPIESNRDKASVGSFLCFDAFGWFSPFVDRMDCRRAAVVCWMIQLSKNWADVGNTGLD